MTMTFRLILILCLALLIFGSFLPWGCQGDLISVCENGIVISFQNGFHLENNGGLVVLILCVIAGWLIFYQPISPERSILWALIAAVILLIYSIIIIGIWVLKGIQQRGITGAPTLAIGLGFILTASIILIFLALRRYRELNSLTSKN